MTRKMKCMTLEILTFMGLADHNFGLCDCKMDINTNRNEGCSSHRMRLSE